MKIDKYFYHETPEIEKNLRSLKALKLVIKLLPKKKHFEENLRQHSFLKSSVFSARIEGNPLKTEDVSLVSIEKETEDIKKKEISNILKAIRWIYSKEAPKKLSVKLILNLHKLVMTGISAPIGKWRQETSAIFNQAGMAVYLAPPAEKIPELVKALIKRANSKKENGSIRAAVCHFAFEKIHPFLDGNGRVGRLLSTFILKNSGYGFRGLFSLEEYLEKHREDYYDLLSNEENDITGFTEFFLRGLNDQAKKTLRLLSTKEDEKPEDSLLPRRKEILEIIRDHKMVSFDFVRRRFQNISPSNLHYDLQQLIKKGLVKKLGSTRGAIYILGENIEKP